MKMRKNTSVAEGREDNSEGNKKDNIEDYSIEDKRGVIDMIVSLADIDPEVLQIDSIKSVIEFKWATYTKKFFLIQLALMLIFVVCFVLDVSAIA